MFIQIDQELLNIKNESIIIVNKNSDFKYKNDLDNKITQDLLKFTNHLRQLKPRYLISVNAKEELTEEVYTYVGALSCRNIKSFKEYDQKHITKTKKPFLDLIDSKVNSIYYFNHKTNEVTIRFNQNHNLYSTAKVEDKLTKLGYKNHLEEITNNLYFNEMII